MIKETQNKKNQNKKTDLDHQPHNMIIKFFEHQFFPTNKKLSNPDSDNAESEKLAITVAI